MDVKPYGLRSGFLAGGGQLVFNRFTGPGRVGIQSMYVHLPSAEGVARAAGVGLVGAMVGKAIKSVE